jgi:thiol-disulfide isomerase/thioredoxin
MPSPPSEEAYHVPVRRLLTIAAGFAVTAAIVGIVVYGRSNASLLTKKGATAIPAAQRKPAPKLTGASISGTPIDLTAYHGKPVVVNFFASWCSPCKAEAPGLARLAHRFGGRMQMMAVDNAAQDSRAAARRFVRRYGWTFPIVYDPTDHLAYRFGLLGQPTTFVIDQQGRIAWSHAGQISSATIAHVVSSLLQA